VTTEDETKRGESEPERERDEQKDPPSGPADERTFAGSNEGEHQSEDTGMLESRVRLS
jgi:hypothetical protein